MFFKERSIFQHFQNLKTLVEWVSNLHGETHHDGVIHYQAAQISLVHFSL